MKTIRHGDDHVAVDIDRERARRRRQIPRFKGGSARVVAPGLLSGTADEVQGLLALIPQRAFAQAATDVADTLNLHPRLLDAPRHSRDLSGRSTGLPSYSK